MPDAYVSLAAKGLKEGEGISYRLWLWPDGVCPEGGGAGEKRGLNRFVLKRATA